MNNINNYNYLYDITGRTIAVKANSKEGQQIDNATSVLYDGEEWLTFEENIDLLQGLSVNELNINQIVTLFSSGNLTIEELKNWLANNNANLINISSETDSNAQVSFEYEGKNYNISCSWENVEFQTDDYNEVKYDNLEGMLPVPYDKTQYEDLKKTSTAGWCIWKNLCSNC